MNKQYFISFTDEIITMKLSAFGKGKKIKEKLIFVVLSTNLSKQVL